MKKPIIFLDHATGIGGAQISLIMLAEKLKEIWDIHLICNPGDLFEKLKVLDQNVLSLKLNRLRGSTSFLSNLIRLSGEISRYANLINANVIYANTVRASLYAAVSANISKKKYCWHMRDFWLSESKPQIPLFDWAGKFLLSLAADHIITNSQAVADHLPIQKKITVVHNGINLSEFNLQLDTSAFKREYSIPEKSPIVGMVGRLRPWKGQESFLRTAAEISQQHPTAYFLIVGGSPFNVDDGYAESLPELAKSLRIDKRVTFTGHLDDVRPALAAMDIFVHPGDPEPFGLVNIEAMAMKKPVVAFAHGALPEIVVQGETGLLVPPTDEKALADAVTSLIEQPTVAKQMGRAGRKRVETHFTAERMAREIEAVLNNVLG